MNISIYHIALIGGCFTILGALIGALAGYWLSRLIAEKNFSDIAKSKFRSAFAPAKVILKFPQSLGNTEARKFFESALTNQAIAVEEFRPFAKDGTSYQKTWDDYQNTVYGDDALGDANLKWSSGMITPNKEIGNIPFLPYIDKKIDNILRFALIK